MSPIDTWDGATVVFTGGGGAALTVLSVVVAVAVLIGFLATMMGHEKRAYAAMSDHVPVERGPAVEGEPSAY